MSENIIVYNILLAVILDFLMYIEMHGRLNIPFFLSSFPCEEGKNCFYCFVILLFLCKSVPMTFLRPDWSLFMLHDSVSTYNVQ